MACATSKINSVSTSTPYDNASCHPGEFWHAGDAPLAPQMIPLYPHPSSSGSHTVAVSITNSAYPPDAMRSNEHIQDILPITNSSFSAAGEQPLAGFNDGTVSACGETSFFGQSRNNGSFITAGID